MPAMPTAKSARTCAFAVPCPIVSPCPKSVSASAFLAARTLRHAHPLRSCATPRPVSPAFRPRCSAANPSDPGHPVPLESQIQPTETKSSLQHVRLLRRDWYLPGRLLLLLVPILWGGYTVSVKLLYDLPWALNANVFNFVRLALATVIVLPGLLKYLRTKEPAERVGTSASKKAAIVGGFEVGFWTFTVNVLQIIGLRCSTASRAAFLNQLNSIMVPFAAFACGMEKSVGFPVYLASVLSVIGVALFSLDDFASPFTWAGEGVLFLSAFAGTAFMLRSKQYASHPDAFVVVALKIVSQLFLSVFFIIPTVVRHFSRFPTFLSAVVGLFAGATPWLLFVNALLVIFNGVFISWLCTVFHMKGQEAVSASECVVIFASTPIWSAILALPLGERFGFRGLIGAGLIVLSTILASVDFKKKPKTQE